MSDTTPLLKRPIILFMVRAIGIFIAWFIVYDLWLLPDGRLDEWVSVHIVNINAAVLSAFGYEVLSAGRIIALPGGNGIELVDGCNGLEVIGLFLGFVVAYPGTWKNRAWFIPAGILLIYLVNIIRIAVLVLTQVSWPGFFDIMHDYLTTSVFYLVVFVLWVIWAQLTDESLVGSESVADSVSDKKVVE